MRRADIEVPSETVDMDSWVSLACYPRGNFYPLSFGPTMRNRRVTKTCFRTCSTCRSRSQAPLCLCTLCAVSIRAEGTFARLRYLLGGDRPSQTTRLALFLPPIQGSRLEPKCVQGGISPLAPPSPRARLHSLPPILRRTHPSSRLGCSKGARGLSV